MFEPTEKRISEESGYKLKKMQPIGYLHQGRKTWMLLSPPNFSTNLQCWTMAICYGYLEKDSTIYVKEGLWVTGTWSVRYCNTIQEKDVWEFEGEEES